MIARSVAHVAITLRTNLNTCIVILLDERKTPHKIRNYLWRIRTKSANADEHTFLVAILTFAILFCLSVVLDEGKHLGENHQKRDIPAGYVKDGKEVARHDGGPPRK